MAILCVYQFNLQDRAKGAQACFAAVRDKIADWVQGFYPSKGNGPSISFEGTELRSNEGHSVCAYQQECRTHKLAALDWRFSGSDQGVWTLSTAWFAARHAEDDRQIWRLNSLVACDGRIVSAQFSVHVDQPFSILKPASLKGSAPLGKFRSKFLPALLKGFKCTIGSEEVPGRAELLDTRQAEEFVRQRLLNPQRTMPIVTVALNEAPLDYPESGPLFQEMFMPGLAGVHFPCGDITFSDVQSLQLRLLGLARVVFLKRAAAARLTQLLGPALSCENGLRLYWPGLRLDDDPNTHTFYRLEHFPENLAGSTTAESLHMALAERSRAGDQKSVIQAARAALATDHKSHQRLATDLASRLADTECELEQARRTREKAQQELRAVRDQAATLQSELAAIRGQIPSPMQVTRLDRPESDETSPALTRELEELWAENDALHAELEAARRRIAALTAALQNGKKDVGLSAVESTVPASEEGHVAFATVADALNAATERFSDVLVAWDDARKAAETSTYPRADKVFRALRAIAEVGRAYFAAKQGGPPLGPVDLALRQHVPFKYTSFESQTTMSLFGADRVFHHGDVSLLMQRHLTLGGGKTNNCLQIYFDFDDAAERVRIGYCGRHLRFARQRT